MRAKPLAGRPTEDVGEEDDKYGLATMRFSPGLYLRAGQTYTIFVHSSHELLNGVIDSDSTDPDIRFAALLRRERYDVGGTIE